MVPTSTGESGDSPLGVVLAGDGRIPRRLGVSVTDVRSHGPFGGVPRPNCGSGDRRRPTTVSCKYPKRVLVYVLICSIKAPQYYVSQTNYNLDIN